jgi:hypothetical protein
VKYASDIVLGERYLDEQTGIEGTAIALSFFQFGCERVSLELVVEGKIEEYGFDAPRLTRVNTGEKAETSATGGPARGVSHVRPGVVGRGR